MPPLQAGQLTLQALPDYAALVKSGGEVTDVTVAAVTAAASAAAAAAAAAVVAAAGKEIETKLQVGKTRGSVRVKRGPATCGGAVWGVRWRRLCVRDNPHGRGLTCACEARCVQWVRVSVVTHPGHAPGLLAQSSLPGLLSLPTLPAPAPPPIPTLQLSRHLQACPPSVFPFYGLTPAMLRAMSNPATIQANIQATINATSRQQHLQDQQEQRPDLGGELQLPGPCLCLVGLPMPAAPCLCLALLVVPPCSQPSSSACVPRPAPVLGALPRP